MSVKLDIINSMLLSILEAPVSSEDSLHPSAIQALAWFNKNNKMFQSRGWWFNTEYNLSLTPDISSNIILPDGTLKVTCLTRGGFIRRKNKLYDPFNHTFTISDSVTVELVLQLDPDDLPPVAVSYLSAKCVYDFYVAEGSGEFINKYKEDLYEARSALREAECTEAGVNVFMSGIPLQVLSRQQSSSSSFNPNYPGGRG